MPLFQCSTCGTVENTALGEYWYRVQVEKLPPLCSECYSGKWHRLFPKENAFQAGYLQGDDGFIYGPKDPVLHEKIVGKVKQIPEVTK